MVNGYRKMLKNATKSDEISRRNYYERSVSHSLGFIKLRIQRMECCVSTDLQEKGFCSSFLGEIELVIKVCGRIAIFQQKPFKRKRILKH